MDVREWRAGSNQSAAVRPAKKILGDGFGFRSGIRKRKDNGPRTFARHFSRTMLSENAPREGSKEADENGRVNPMDDLAQADVGYSLNSAENSANAPRSWA